MGRCIQFKSILTVCTVRNFPCTRVISLDKQNLADWFAFRMQVAAKTMNLNCWKTSWSFRLFFKTRFGVLQSNIFFRFTLEVSFWWVWGSTTIPKMYWSQTLNECKVCKCAVTAYSAVSLSLAEWVKPTSFGEENRIDKCWHRVLDGVLLVKTRMFAECHGGCVTFFFKQPSVRLNWFCYARLF